MAKTIYLNFNDLKEEVQDTLLRDAEQDIREDESEMCCMFANVPRDWERRW